MNKEIGGYWVNGKSEKEILAIMSEEKRIDDLRKKKEKKHKMLMIFIVANQLLLLLTFVITSFLMREGYTRIDAAFSEMKSLEKHLMIKCTSEACEEFTINEMANMR